MITLVIASFIPIQAKSVSKVVSTIMVTVKSDDSSKIPGEILCWNPTENQYRSMNRIHNTQNKEEMVGTCTIKNPSSQNAYPSHIRIYFKDTANPSHLYSCGNDYVQSFTDPNYTVAVEANNFQPPSNGWDGWIGSADCKIIYGF